MTHHGDAYATLDFPEKKMIGKSLQIDATSALVI